MDMETHVYTATDHQKVLRYTINPLKSNGIANVYRNTCEVWIREDRIYKNISQIMILFGNWGINKGRGGTRGHFNEAGCKPSNPG